MDRNLGDDSEINIGYVALRKESVDRNIGVGTTRDRRGVALRKESVDRNIRREMSLMRPYAVALRKESVDRNMLSKATRISVMGRSPQGERG